MSTHPNSKSNDNDTGRLPVTAFLSSCRLTGAGDLSAGSGSYTSIMPLVDVRSPGEFSQGHIPGALNMPLFSNEERAIVGTVYKNEGRDEAVFRGMGLVGSKMEYFARRAVEIAGAGKNIAMYCSRGGMRSGAMSWLFTQAGINVRLLEGGYKAFRRYVLDFFEGMGKADYKLHVLGGRTGSGKTEVLHHMAGMGAQVLDLEGMACHRGSAFGAMPGIPQPSNEHFSNLLALSLARLDPSSPIWLEDESENIGAVNQPMPFFRALRSSPLVVLDVPHPLRLKRVLNDYGDFPRDAMDQALDRIKKRLGGLAHKQAHELLDKGDLPGLAVILLEYYDRAYDKQMRQRALVATVQASESEEAAKRLEQFNFETLHLE